MKPLGEDLFTRPAGTFQEDCYVRSADLCRALPHNPHGLRTPKQDIVGRQEVDRPAVLVLSVRFRRHHRHTFFLATELHTVSHWRGRDDSAGKCIDFEISRLT